MLDQKRILLIISGGIAAYKSLEFIRRLKDRGCEVRCILTEGGSQFVTPLSVAALSGEKVFSDLFSLTDEAEMGHIRLSREADLVVVAPASAGVLAKMAMGLASDLATTALLATDKPVMVAPAMNVEMWAHPATQRNIGTLRADGIDVIGPAEGDLACGETGSGRMVEPDELLQAVELRLGDNASGALAGRRALVTSGPTREAIDPVRYISNFSSGKQGHAIARALAALGADTTLVSGPTHEPNPDGVFVVQVESAADMMAACEAALPVDVAVCAAAVSDWRVSSRVNQKIKKEGDTPPSLQLTENPDILASIAQHARHRPRLVVGFAAETENLIDNATLKRVKKGCDWIVANDVSEAAGTFGSSENSVHLITEQDVVAWPRLSKVEVAQRLGQTIADHVAEGRPAA
ncbi:MAG: bifunctional phosphopantothenoylcysteine decarboxylase/phosphopantothenate--cysteine ligase CoaBC [Alphaproteobacteria bacterium]|nr:bifunctional phosphopantothenoylcysteine decarboxylase/phosphopantothenate--cysteine ligase CoaBC [Alphaproteobacteria bacterium]|tara:strand:+ start:3768 stop:4988 length:1221 start_codon:yes stop_codon:yes gene_type:complete